MYGVNLTITMYCIGVNVLLFLTDCLDMWAAGDNGICTSAGDNGTCTSQEG